MLQQFFIALLISCTVVLPPVLCALWYFHRVRMDRPPVGVFNGQDIVILLCIVTILPILYLAVPPFVLTIFLCITFFSALYNTFRPFFSTLVTCLLAALLLLVNIVITVTILHTPTGEILYWLSNSLIVGLAVPGVSNLYVQGGMQMRHAAWFALALAFYDGFFAFVIPITPRLDAAFMGHPLVPAIGYLVASNGLIVGLGDLFMYSLFTLSAYKGFGRRGLVLALAVMVIFGLLCPVLTPFFLVAFFNYNQPLIPAQVFFGPFAFLSYLWLAHHAPERRMSAWYRVQEASGYRIIRIRRRARPA